MIQKLVQVPQNGSPNQAFHKSHSTDNSLYDANTSPTITNGGQDSVLLEELLREKQLLMKMLKEYEMEINILRSKNIHINELEAKLDFIVEKKIAREKELVFLRIQLSEKELQVYNEKENTKNLCSKITLLEDEINKLRHLHAPVERMLLENVSLRKTLNQLVSLKKEYEKLKNYMKYLYVLREERNMYKKKCETLQGIEVECDHLRLQIEKNCTIEYEKLILETQVEELEASILSQEQEITILIEHINQFVDKNG